VAEEGAEGAFEVLEGSDGGRGGVALCEPGGWRSSVWRMDEGVLAAHGSGGGTEAAEQSAGGVLPRSGSAWGHCIAFGDRGTVQSHAGAVCRESGRHTVSHRPGEARPGVGAEAGRVTLFSHSGMQLQPSMALPAWAPLPLPSSTALPDFPRCPFPLC